MALKPRIRGRKHLGPFILNFTHRGLTSVAVKVGPFTRNLTRGTTSIDGPGIFNGVLTPDRSRRSSGPILSTGTLARWGCGAVLLVAVAVVALLALALR